MIGIMTDATCGLACWSAREQDCRCSCAGKNHGFMRGGSGEQPRRTCKIDGRRYVLGAVGKVASTGDRWRYEARETLREKYGVAYNGSYRMIPSSLFVARLASPRQAETWPEARLIEDNRGRLVRPTLLWIREDAIDDFDAWAQQQQ